ncbi:MAG: N-acetyl-alpha-D-glucosaminyl L-malate synthase BshA [Chitinophagales bacterium]|nr:N-acetyl-alpha-D-glucosaminyl L-malate synthase BshA [Chitinophagales bacterium]
MKIGIVCYPTYGGSGVVATELGKALAKEGHQVHFITYMRPPRLDVFQPNVFFHEVSFQNYALFEYPPYETALASNLVDIVKYQKLDLLHVHYAIPHASAAYIAKQILKEQGIYIPVITTLHGTDITLVGKAPAYRSVVAFSINQSDGITTVSESLKKDTYTNFDISKDIEVIPNFIDFTRFTKLNKEHFKKAIAPNNERILIHTSNFRKVKRVEDTVRIFEKVRKEVNAKLLLVGDGPERACVEELARKLEVEKDVIFLGKQDAVEELLAIADLYLMPSESESFGLAALEAMACEVPVISSNTGGIPEINIEGLTGFLSDVGDVDAMARNAISILSNEEKLIGYKQNALAQAKKFDISLVLPVYENYYQEVIKRAKAYN